MFERLARGLSGFIVLVTFLAHDHASFAQQSYELVVPGANTRSAAELSASTLRITNLGKTDTYDRSPQYDTVGYIGYASNRLGQVVRWPASGSGPMQIGTLSPAGVSFRESRMRVQPLGGRGANIIAGRPGGNIGGNIGAVSQPDTGHYHQLTNAFLGVGRSLDANRRGTLSMGRTAASESQYWQLIPAGGGRYRLTNAQLGADWSLTANLRSRLPTMERTDARLAEQLWAVKPSGRNTWQIIHESQGTEWALDNDGGGSNDPVLDRRGAATGQMWTFTRVAAIPDMGLVGTWAEHRTADDGPRGLDITIRPDLTYVQIARGREVVRGTIAVAQDRLTLIHADGTRESYRFTVGRDRVDFWRGNGLPEAFYWRAVAAGRPVPGGLGPGGLAPRLISRKPVANPPLEPASIEFANSRDLELWVLVSDLRNAAASLRLKIPPGQSKAVLLDRDAGGTIVETWEVPLRSGETVLDQRELPIPAQQIYAVSVYEMIVQSISIDRTRKGGPKIDEINHSPKSVGSFPVPAGARLLSGKTDVYDNARRQNNPGAVVRIHPGQWAGE